MRAGDTLSFSYSAVFGATAPMCDGIGVAGFLGDGKREYVDEQGTVTFTKDGWKPAFRCKVIEPKAHFLIVGSLPPAPRKGFVVKGNWVEAIGLVNEGSPTWLLTRFVGKKQTTAGLLERDALECHEG